MQTIFDNKSKLQIRAMAWMRNSEWRWYFTHVDWMNSLMPRTGLTSMLVWFTADGLSFGCDSITNLSNGPND